MKGGPIALAIVRDDGVTSRPRPPIVRAVVPFATGSHRKARAVAVAAGEERMVTIEPYRDAFFGGVKALWEESFPDDPPWNRAEIAIPAKMAQQPDLFVVAVDRSGSDAGQVVGGEVVGGQVVGAALGGYDGHRGWIYSVAVREHRRREKLGARLVGAMEARFAELGCVKINLQVRSLNLGLVNFYHGVGYRTDDRITMGKLLTRPA